MPFPGNDQIIILQAFVGLGKARYQPHLVGPGFQVLHPGKAVALIQAQKAKEGFLMGQALK